MAEVVLKSALESVNLDDVVAVESAAIGEWHVGEKADVRARTALHNSGFVTEPSRASQFDVDDFARYDVVVGLDGGHCQVLRTLATSEADKAKVHLFTDFDPKLRGQDRGIVDPYYGEQHDFETVLREICSVTDHLVEYLKTAVDLTERPD